MDRDSGQGCLWEPTSGTPGARKVAAYSARTVSLTMFCDSSESRGSAGPPLHSSCSRRVIRWFLSRHLRTREASVA
jgi:hypothetical protein